MPCCRNPSSEERSRHPSFSFLWKDVPAIFPKKGKERKDGGIGIRHHGWKRFLSAEERKRKKKKAKERNPPVCRAPVLGKRAKRKGGTPFFGTVLPSCKKGNASRCGIRKRRKGKPSPAHRGESPLAFLSEKRKEEKRSTVLSLPPLLFRMFPLLHSSKRREAASHRYAGCSKRC